jgi:hypothetical protein
MKMRMRDFICRVGQPLAIATCALLVATQLIAANDAPQVSLDVAKAGPRVVESLTERALVRDYKFAWASLDTAMGTNSTDPLNGLFVGTANSWLGEALQGQRRGGITSRYLNQVHKVDAVFYAPEGDVIELHDNSEYDLEIRDGNKTIHSEHAKVDYIVLMTPAADRWVIRQLQAIPHP